MTILALVDQVPMALASGILATINDPGINTDLPGLSAVEGLVGGIKFLALMACLASLFIGGGAWGLATWGGNGSTWGRRFALGGAVGAVVIGLGAEIVNSLSDLA